ncbi:MAG TPA: ABC transporter substrate-binding protein [Acidimicrobiales bacterium]
MKRAWKLVAVVGAVALTVAACGDDDDDTVAGDDAGGASCTDQDQDGPTVQIGAQDFGESLILAEIYAGALECQGIEAEITEVGGFRDLLFQAIEAGDVNLAPEYVASELEFLNDNAGEATSDVDETLGLLEPLLEERELVALEPSSAVNTNAFVITQETSEEMGIETLSDLAEEGEDLTLGAPQDCEDNPFCLPGLERVYGLDLSENFTPLDTGLIPTALGEGEIDVAVLFSTDGRIADEGWVLLEDDQQMLAADNVFPLATQELVDAYGDTLTGTLGEVSAALTTEELTELNKLYDVDHDEAEDIAEDWLAEHELG